MKHHEAWEAVRQEWAFLPAEKDEPELGEEPGELSRPGIPTSQTETGDVDQDEVDE